jgi:alkylation response protein AidB-like acyl-CoA dehydrogenase
MNKIVSTNIGHDVARLALDLLDEEGLLSPQSAAMQGRIPKEAPAWLTQYMWSLGVAIAGGTANVQRNIIAERVLGLPRDYYQQSSKG